MFEEFEYTGKWWLPTSPNKRIAGRLKFSQEEGAILLVDGNFSEKEKGPFINPEIINGLSSAGVDITLYNCIQRKLTLHDGSHATSEFSAHFIFVGINFEKQGDMIFHRMKIHYSRLDEWLGVTGFETKKDGEEITIKYRRPDSVLAIVNDELRLEIVFSYSWSPFMLNEANLKQTSLIQIDTTHPKNFDEFQPIMRQMQNFLTLANLEPVYPSSIIGITDFQTWKEDNVINYPQVGIFYQLAGATLPQDRASSSMPLFSFKSVSSKFEELIINWFRKMELLEPVEQLYFGLFYNPSMYSEQKFLCCIQAVEAYHRRTTDNMELPPIEHEERLSKILKNTPQEYKDWLKDELEHSNEPSLRKRLKELLRENKSILKDYIADQKKFINKVIDTRNCFTHYTTESCNRAAKKEELHQITEQLKMMIEICFLSELGFSQNEIRSLIETRYRHRKSYLQGSLREATRSSSTPIASI